MTPRTSHHLSRTALAAVAIAAVIALASEGAASAHRFTARSSSATTAPEPAAIKASTLTQDGRELVWKLTMVNPFSPRAMGRTGRTLCLGLYQPRMSKDHQLCVIGPAVGSHTDRLRFTAPNGVTRVIRAQVTRPARNSLTATLLPAAAGISYSRLRWNVTSTVTGDCGADGSCGGALTTGTQSLKLHTPVLVGCEPTGAPFVNAGPSHRREIALTFDDGPSPDPPAIDFVRLLHRYRVPATFFEIGEQIPEYDPTGSVERLMLRDGDMIGDHTWTHPDMTKLSSSDQRHQIERTAAAIRHATGFTPCLFRAPYGAVNSGLIGLAHSLHFATIQWDVDTVDWSLPGTTTIENRAISGAHDGAIILQHFGGGPRYQTYDALPTEIKTLRARGYRFVTVTKLLGYRLLYR